MNKYDAICVLGYTFDETWKLPEHLKKRLVLVADYYKNQIAPLVITTGNHSIHWDWDGIAPPHMESELMRDELIRHGVPEDHIAMETYSKDTPGNIYFLKTKILIPKGIKSILLMCATHHEERVKFLCQKILGNDIDYTIEATYSPGSDNEELVKHEKAILDMQNSWMNNMTDGDHA